MPLDDYDTQIQCEEFYGDPHIDDDEDFLPDEEETYVLLPEDEDDLLMDEEDNWFTDDGGLTADAYEWLAERDKENGFC